MDFNDPNHTVWMNQLLCWDSMNRYDRVNISCGCSLHVLFLCYSPSDLEADLEDNQDYDSTVSQSETNLTMIGRIVQPHGTAPSQAPPPGKFRMRNPITESITLHKSSLSSITTTPGGTDPDSCKEEDEVVEDDVTQQRVINIDPTPAAAPMMTASASNSSSSATPNVPPQQRPVSYPSRFVDKDLDMESYMASVAASEPSPGGVGAPLKSSLSNRIQNKENLGTSVGSGSSGRGTRDHVRWRDRTGSNDAAMAERLAHLEQVNIDWLIDWLIDRLIS